MKTQNLELTCAEMVTLKLLRDETRLKAFGGTPAHDTTGRIRVYNDENREAQRLLPVLEKILKAAVEVDEHGRARTNMDAKQ